MELDLLSAMEVTACAAIAVAVLSAGFGDTARARRSPAGGTLRNRHRPS